MLVRLALERDEDRVVEFARCNVEETVPEDVEAFEEYVVRDTYRQYLETANPTIFVVEKNREVVGMLMAYVGTFDYKSGHWASQKVLYVTPENRGTRAAVLLMKEFIAWAKQLGIVELVGGNDNGFNSERTAAFLEHFGFKRVGYSMLMRLTDGWR